VAVGICIVGIGLVNNEAPAIPQGVFIGAGLIGEVSEALGIFVACCAFCWIAGHCGFVPI